MNDTQASPKKAAKTPTGAPVALITGASAGIGAAIARRLAKGGYRIVAVARRPERLEKLAKDLSATTAVEIFPADVTAPGIPQRAVDLAMKTFGRLDCLVNNAGSGKWGSVDQIDDAALNEVIEMSIRAPFLFCRAALPVLTKPGSSIITVGSTYGVIGGMWGGIYAAAKAGLIGLTKSLACDYGSSGIRANYVAPGVIRTEMTDAHWDTPSFQRTNHEQTPFYREGTVEDVANAVYFLVSEEGGYINGQTLALDGGWSETKFVCAEALGRGLS